jgi:hypothetical protein
MKYRIIKYEDGFEEKFFIQKKYKFLFFTFWRYIVDEYSFPDNFYRRPMAFMTEEWAMKYIKKLEVVPEKTITKEF